MASITSDEAFIYAVEQAGIGEIEIKAGITLENELEITQNLTIPKGIDGIELDFKNSNVPSLTIAGNNNTIENLTVNSLNIQEDVKDLILDNIKDKEDSQHNFAGGGGESIVFKGDTVFAGDIRITSTKDDIQIRAESEGAKIEGNVWIESEKPVRIAAPVSKLIVNSSGSKLQIESKVEKPVIEVRAGVKVEVKDENNEDITESISIECILDTYQLERYLQEAGHRINNTHVGDRNGQVPLDKKTMLETLKASAEKALNEAKNQDINQGNINQIQTNIDATTKDLRKAIDDFIDSIIIVRRHELHSQIKRAEEIARSGQYSGQILEELNEKIQAARNLYGKKDVSQEEIDQETRSLKEFIESKLVVNEGNLSFLIKGDFYKDTEATVEIYEGINKDRYSQGSRPETKTQHLEDGVKIDLDFKGTLRGDNFYLTIELYGKDGHHLFIEDMDLADLESGVYRELNAQDLVPLELSIPTDEELVEHPILSIHVANQDNKGLIGKVITSNTRIPEGRYNFQYNTTTENQAYTLFKEGVSIDRENPVLKFTEEELVLIDLELTYSLPINYDFKDISLMREDYNFIFSPKLVKGGQSIYTTKGSFTSIAISLMFEQDERYWNYRIGKSDDFNLENNKTIQINDSFKIDIKWDYEKPIDIDTSLYYYIGGGLDGYIKNDLGQELIQIWEAESMKGNHIADVNGRITIKANDREYSKPTNGFYFGGLTIRDIIGDAKISGEVTIEFAVDDIPPNIQPITKTIIIEGKDEGIGEED